MEQIAVDIVLLPVEEVMNKAIEVNRELLKSYPGEIKLDKENCLPHISLAMGCIEKNSIPRVNSHLSAIAEKYPIVSLKFAGFRTEINSSKEKVTVARIEKSQTLQLLHEEVMTDFKAYFSYEVTSDMLLSNEKVSESTLLWIRNYAENSSFERFSPHITIGYGQIENYSFPREIPVSRIAMCHLGNHCTCRKVLGSVLIVKRA
jgi:2'-5' RNA ligase